MLRTALCALAWVLLACPAACQTVLPTVTVRGFLNFKTTVDGTVIVFTPASEVHHHHHPSTAPPDPAFETSDMDMGSPVQNSLDPVQTQAPTANIVEKKEDEAFHHDNAVLPSSINELEKASPNQYPTGLVTVLGGTLVDGSSTTVFETKVIGTYIEGKYAQVLQSTSYVDAKPIVTTPPLSYSTVERSYTEIPEPESVLVISVSQEPSSESSLVVRSKPQESISILSTPSLHIPSSSSEEVKIETVSKLTTLNTVSKPSTVESKSSETKQLLSSFQTTSPTTISTIEPSQSSTLTTTLQTKSSVPTSVSTRVVKSSDNKIELLSSRPPMTYSKTNLYSSFLPSVSFDSEEPTQTLEIPKKLTVSKISLSTRQPEEMESQKSNRNNSSRTRFLSPRRPSQTVRLNRFKVKLTLRHDSADEYNVTLPAEDEEMEEDHTNKVDEDMEVVTADSNLAHIDPAKVVFQETTITSEVTLHVGRRKSVRTLTITTSVPLTVHPTDIQEILAAESTLMDDLDQHIVTRTFTTTERTLKTSVVPVFDGKSTAYHTVTESFFILKLITAYRTLPPGDASILESVMEEPDIAETTLEVAANIQPSVTQSIPPEELLATEEEILPSMFTPPPAAEKLSNPFLSLGHALSNNPLAAVYLGLQQLNAQMTLYSTVTDTSTFVTTETLYSTKSIRFYDGRSTRYRTVSEPTATRKRTVTTTATSLQPYLNTQAIQQQQQLQQLIAAPRLEPPQFSTRTSVFTTVTTTTSPSTRVYTLIYNGFSTKFRTVTSYSVFPTTVTVTSTTQVPVAPTMGNVPFVYPYTP